MQVKSDSTLPHCEFYYKAGISNKNSKKLMNMSFSHIMILFFFIDGLHILQKQDNLQQQQKEKLIEYILNLQLKNGGFAPSTLFSCLNSTSEYEQGHIVFTYSAVNCLAVLNALDKVDRSKVLSSVGRHQKSDGSFSSFQNSTECDLRFVYSALSICKIFNDFSHINTTKALDFIQQCYNFDGGYGLRSGDQSHGGAIYCAVASYDHLGVEIPKQKKLKTINFLVNRQCKDENNQIGVQGRVGKQPDSCYSFWVGASLKILTGKNLLNPQVEQFIMSCFKSKQMSFSKYPKSQSGDPVHTFHSITGLKILKQNADNLSLSHIMRLSALSQNRENC